MSFVKRCENCNRDFRSQADFFSKTTGWRLCSRNNVWFNCSCGSTLMIAKENCPWFSFADVMGSNNWSIFVKITEKQKLPHIPYQVMQVLQMVQDENVNSKQIAGLVRNDPMLASKILSTANNLKISGGGTIESLEHAITFIGYKILKDIIITAALSAIKVPTKHYKQEMFWKDALLTGYICDTLARWVKAKVAPDLAYVCGALCNLGKLVLAICEPKLADQVHLLCTDPKSPMPWQKAEAIAKAPSHTALGEIGSIFWGMPEVVILSARHHHADVEQKDAGVANSRELLTLVKFANQLAHWVNLSPFEQDEALLEQCRRFFNLSVTSMEDFVAVILANQNKLKV